MGRWETNRAGAGEKGSALSIVPRAPPIFQFPRFCPFLRFLVVSPLKEPLWRRGRLSLQFECQSVCAYSSNFSLLIGHCWIMITTVVFSGIVLLIASTESCKGNLTSTLPIFSHLIRYHKWVGWGMYWFRASASRSQGRMSFLCFPYTKCAKKSSENFLAEVYRLKI